MALSLHDRPAPLGVSPRAGRGGPRCRPGCGGPAELLTVRVGINMQARGSHHRDALASALVGFVRTVREGHPDGHPVFASRFLTVLQRAGCVP